MQLNLRQLLSSPRAAAFASRLRSACEPYLARTRELLTPYWRRAAEWYEKREPREKLLLLLLGGVAAILFIYEAVYVPARAWRDDLAQQVTTREHQVVR